MWVFSYGDGLFVFPLLLASIYHIGVIHFYWVLSLSFYIVFLPHLGLLFHYLFYRRWLLLAHINAWQIRHSKLVAVELPGERITVINEEGPPKNSEWLPHNEVLGSVPLQHLLIRDF